MVVLGTDGKGYLGRDFVPPDLEKAVVVLGTDSNRYLKWNLVLLEGFSTA